MEGIRFSLLFFKPQPPYQVGKKILFNNSRYAKMKAKQVLKLMSPERDLKIPNCTFVHTLIRGVPEPIDNGFRLRYIACNIL